MELQNTINQCIGILEESFNKEVIFDDPIIIKTSPHNEIFRCYGASTNNKRLAVMDPAGEWHEVEAEKINVKYVVNSLLQRLKTMVYVGS